jgi:Flp pilus assembly protein TadD
MIHPSDPPGFPSRTELLIARAKRAQQRGERRQALVALREAALLAESDARVWALYGSACFRANRLDEAERAFGQAIYFRQRARDSGRVRALRTMIERLALVRAA